VEQALRETYNIIFDDREQYKPGYKYTEWELQGIPLRIEIGPRDEAQKQVVIARRDSREKISISADELRNKINELLVSMQRNLFTTALSLREENTHDITDYKLFKKQIESPGGFFNTGWCGSLKCEEQLKEETKATIRLIPFDQKNQFNSCLICGSKSEADVVIARAY
jgi:prolyl-tRNA synthetase